MKRRICFVLTTRGNYGKVKSTMTALQKESNCQLQIIIGGPLVQERYGDYKNIIEHDGFKIDASISYLDNGETLLNMLVSAGNCTTDIGKSLMSLSPDIVVVVADRYEALSISQAALCLNIPIAHIEGGEVSGTIDDKIRNAISQIAEIHFPSNCDAANNLLGMGVDEERTYTVGTPSLDLLNELDLDDLDPVQVFLDSNGKHDRIDLSQEYIVVSQHPVVTEYEQSHHQYSVTASALSKLGYPLIWILPNVDAGANEALIVLNEFRKDERFPSIQTLGSMPFELYAPLLVNSLCLIGNTSSGLREGAFLGVPVVNIGSRQKGRLRGNNVVDVSHDEDEIIEAIKQQIEHGRYSSDPVYGSGESGKLIAKQLLNSQNMLSLIN
jgi:GDP/UDP-N,N'-diacetylbacillosamine 2-epimerase (hydrolysing)